MSSLVSEMPRQSPELRESGAGRVRGLMNLVRRFLPADARPGAATAVTSTLVGALQLARALGDNAEGGRCWPRRARRCCRATNRRVNARRIEGCRAVRGQFLIPEYDDHHIFPRVKRNARPQGAVFLESVQSCLPRFLRPRRLRRNSRVSLAGLLDRQRRGLPGVAGRHLAVRRLRRAACRLSPGLGGRHVVGAERLHRGLCRHADPFRRAGRRLWPQAHVPDRRGPVPGGVGGLRPGRRRGLAGGRARGAGGRRGLADAGVAVHRAGRLSGRAAHRGREPVGRGGGAGGGGRPQPGRFRGGRGGLALGLLHQRAAGRAVAGAARACCRNRCGPSRGGAWTGWAWPS